MRRAAMGDAAIPLPLCQLKTLENWENYCTEPILSFSRPIFDIFTSAGHLAPFWSVRHQALTFKIIKYDRSPPLIKWGASLPLPLVDRIAIAILEIEMTIILQLVCTHASRPGASTVPITYWPFVPRFHANG